MGDDLKAAEQRAYSRGYQAGRKRADVDADLTRGRRERARAERLFRQQVFCAALQATIVSGGWATGGVKWKTGDDYVRGCKSIADDAVNQFRGEIVA